MPDPNQTDILEPLRKRYLENMRRSCISLRGYLTKNPTVILSDEDRSLIADTVHKFIGTGKIFGFPQITKIGAALEALLLQDPKCSDKEVQSSLKKFVKVCDDALAAATKDTRP